MPRSSTNFGPYELIYPLGSGGMGEVFLARHEGEHGIQRLVALKRLLVHLRKNRELVRLFLDEVRIVAQLNHGNIVQVIDHGEIQGQCYMAMEYIHGENLAEMLERLEQRGQQVPLPLLLLVACCVCEGLDYAHRKQSIDGKPLGIVHRDISPHNILVSFQGEVKVADFGVARAAEQTHETLGGELKGKLAYMSPEQATGKPLDHRSDLYSLGVLLYEALAGRNPLRRETSMATLELVREPQIPSLAMLRPDLPPEVVQLVHKALSPRREQRQESARAMHEEVGRIILQHQLTASPFELADGLRALFPECGPRDREADDSTAVGRRADADLDQQQQHTLLYLRQRHPDADQTVGLEFRETTDTGQIQERVTSSRGPLVVWLLALTAVALAGVGGGWLLRENGPAAADRDGGPGPAELSRGPADARGVSDGPRRDAAAAERTRRPPAARATLTIHSIPPGAWVKLAGRRLPGTTPLTWRGARGRYRYTVGLKGYRPFSDSVTLRAGRNTIVKPRLEARRGTLTVRSSVACRVQLRGARIGETPIYARAVEPGRLAVTCLNAARGIRQTRQVSVRPGEATEVVFRFGVLNINLDPWANVVVDGRARGTTPARLHLSVGEHQVLLRNPKQGLMRRRAVEIKAGQTHRISSW